LEFRNSFIDQTQRLPLQVPIVQVDDLVEISVQTDRSSYAQNEAVGIEVGLYNDDAVNRQGQLQVRVVDDTGAEVIRLIDRAETFPARYGYALNPPFNTGAMRAGEYRIEARVLNTAGEIEAIDEASFSVTAGDGGAVLSSTVATDRSSYPSTADVFILAQLSNLSANQGLSDLRVIETVLDPAGAVLWSQTQPVINLEPLSQRSLEFALPLQAAVAGLYQVQQQVIDASDQLLSEAVTTFDVVAEQGTDALDGSVQAQPATLRLGQTTTLSASVHNRSSVSVTGMPAWIRVLDPANGMTVLAEWPFQINLQAGQSQPLEASWRPVDVSLGSYLVVLMVGPADQERALDQAPVQVGDLILTGSMTVDPSVATRQQTISLTAQVANAGNLTAAQLPLEIRVVHGDSSAAVMTWSRLADLSP
ncbi:MAG: hypothetical protein KDI56_17950, partial [Xanthomonadales bacterium]|nr:hypothetical protein [Xanthomonadales bacterium]